MPMEMILKLVGIEIHRCERQPGEQSHAAGELRFHNVAHMALHMAVEIRTDRLMDITDAKRLVVGQKGFIPECGVEKKVPGGQRAQPWREPGFLPHEVLV